MGDAPRRILSPLAELRKAKSENDLRDERPVVAAQGKRAARKTPPDLAAVVAAGCVGVPRATAMLLQLAATCRTVAAMCCDARSDTGY